MDKLLEIIEDNKEVMTSGLYMNLMNELKKIHDESDECEVMVKLYALIPINVRSDNTFYINFEEKLYDSKIIKIKKEYDFLIKGKEVYKDIYEDHIDLYVMLINHFKMDVEEFECMQNEDTIWYKPAIHHYTFTLL